MPPAGMSGDDPPRYHPAASYNQFDGYAHSLDKKQQAALDKLRTKIREVSLDVNTARCKHPAEHEK